MIELHSPNRRVDGRNSRWDRHRQERRRELVETTMAIIEKSGPSVSMDDIAAACRTSKSILYRYFTDKAGLRLGISQYVNALVEKEMEAAYDPNDALAAPTAGMRRLLEFLAEKPSTYAFVMSDNFEYNLSAVKEISRIARKHIAAAIYRLLTNVEGQEVVLTKEQNAIVDLWATAAGGAVRAIADTWVHVNSAKELLAAGKLDDPKERERMGVCKECLPESYELILSMDAQQVARQLMVGFVGSLGTYLTGISGHKPQEILDCLLPDSELAKTK